MEEGCFFFLEERQVEEKTLQTQEQQEMLHGSKKERSEVQLQKFNVKDSVTRCL